MVIAVLGGAFAVMIALWSLDNIRAVSPANVLRFQETSVDATVLLFTMVVVLATTLLVGIWPAMRISDNASMADELHENGGRGSEGVQRQRSRSILVVAQVALAVVLLTAAGLTLKSFQRAGDVPLGFDSHGVVTMSVSLPHSRYDSPQKISNFFDRLLEKVQALPGVAAAAVSTNAPFDHNEWDSSFHVTGTPPDPPGQEPDSEMSIISPGYFGSLNMPVLRGRAFDAHDVAGRQVVMLIDQMAAEKFFHGQNPVGKQIDDPVTITEPNQPSAPITIVGEVPHARTNPVGSEFEARHLPVMYFCASQFPQAEQLLMVKAAAGRDPLSLVDAIKQQVTSLDPDQPIADVATMDERIAESLAPRRLSMSLMGVFALLALGLASIGLYGVMALAVTQRTRELGIRLALGAARGDVFRLVLGQGMLLVVGGVLCGLLIALSAGRALSSILYNVPVWDPRTFFGAAITLAIVALLACWLPAYRASRVDPITALKSE